MIDTILAKLGVLAVSPFMVFGGQADVQGNVAAKAHAQEGSSYETVCTDLEHNLSFGSRDRNTDGEVSELQHFLKAEGYLTKKAPNGFYGMATYRAVREFQGDHDLRRSGFVGELTRDKIQDVSCDEEPNEVLEITSIEAPSSLDIDEEGTWTVNVESETDGNLSYSVKWGDENMWSRMWNTGERTQSSATFTHSYSNEGTYTPIFTVTDAEGNTVSEEAVAVTVGDDDGELTISSLSASWGYAGGEITVTGEGFLTDSDVYVGSTKIDATVDSDTSLRFDIPSLGKGSYDVYVENAHGTSNKLTLEVKEKTYRLSINGIDAPSRLKVGQEGTWTVKADTNIEGNLSYSVDWGDAGNSMMRHANEASWSTSSTFTHTYETAGTYKPTFTVSDGNGKTSKVSATVIVTK